MFGTTVGRSIGSKVPNQVKSTPKQKPKKPIRYHDYLADYGGCGHWRMIWPQMILNSTQTVVGSNTSSMIIDDMFYRDLKSVRIQRQVTPNQLKFVKILREKADRLGFNIIYEIDDIFVLKDIPMYNAFRDAYTDPELQKSAIQILKLADIITVPSEQMRQYYSVYNKNVKLIPNYPPKFWLDGIYDNSRVVESLATTTRPKIMYSGSTAHYDMSNKNNGVDDFSHILDLVNKTVDKYEWIFIGALPPKLTSLHKSGKIKLYPWHNIYNLPTFLSNLNINAFIAPLNDNTFNRCKSDIKIIEAGGLGIPCICQDLPTYSMSPLKFKTGDDLADQLNYILSDCDTYSKYSKQYNDITNTRWLDDNYDKYIDVITNK